jgi:hypothetical protein
MLGLLLMGLWISSYWWIHQVQIASTLFFVSKSGNVDVALMQYPVPDVSGVLALKVGDDEDRDRWPHMRWLLSLKEGAKEARVPHWFAIATCCAFAGAPWIRLRVSLRSLLIITTIVAVALGLIIYFTRS